MAGPLTQNPTFSAYACSKAAVVRLTGTLAEEVKDYNIQVNAIVPGAVKTRMVERIRGCPVTIAHARLLCIRFY